MFRKTWFVGVRFYIAVAIVLISLQAWWWAAVTYGGSNVTTIRLQEVYAWLSLLLLTVALLIGPLLKVFPHMSGKMVLRDARRMIGIGAAWFALLHALLSYGALFNWPNPASLSVAYQQSLGLGLLGLVILALLALTSFDTAMRRLGPWWFRLHRLVYVAALGALLHTFMIGTHAAELFVVGGIGLVAVMLTGLHGWLLLRAEKPSNLQVITLSLLIVMLAAVINYGFSQYLGYNFFLDRHQGYQP